MMGSADNFKQANRRGREIERADQPLHPAWRAFIRYCVELQHGEIEVLRIQDGLPVLAELTRMKVRFSP